METRVLLHRIPLAVSNRIWACMKAKNYGLRSLILVEGSWYLFHQCVPEVKAKNLFINGTFNK